MEYSLVVKRNTFLTQVTTCMNFRCTMLRSQIQKATDLVNPFIHTLAKAQGQKDLPRAELGEGLITKGTGAFGGRCGTVSLP